MNQRVLAVLRKELREFRRNKFVVGVDDRAAPAVHPHCPSATSLSIKAGHLHGRHQPVVGGAGLTFFLVPLILPTVIAGYAVVGEREQGTLEPVLTHAR